MSEINVIFYTDDKKKGYQLGLNVVLSKQLTEKENDSLHTKLSFIFKTFNYGLDIAKINEIVKFTLINEGISEQEISLLEICIVNKQEWLSNKKIKHMDYGSLKHDIKEYGLDNNQEICIAKFITSKLSYYKHKNAYQKFVYNDTNGIKMEHDNLSNYKNRRKNTLNKYLKNNIDNINKLENTGVYELKKELNINDSILISAYKLFYDEEPDFNDADLYCKIQCMSAILDTSVIRLFPSVSEHNYHIPDITFPESMYIKDQILKLSFIIDNDFSQIEPFNFKAMFGDKIRLYGEVIRSYLLSIPEEEKMEFLKLFAVNYVHSIANYCYIPDHQIDPKSNELMLLLRKKEKSANNDAKN